MDRQTTRLSKRLSKILRHAPEQIGLKLDAAGWGDVSTVLSGLDLTIEQLDQIVAHNNKKRFEYSEDGKRIRARQGHTVEVDLGYTPIEPPDELYHGTSWGIADVIRAEGIKKMSRHQVHLSPDRSTAKIVGARHGAPVVLCVDTKRMREDGINFYRTLNDVWLVDYVDPKYIKG